MNPEKNAFTDYVRILARGRNASRNMTREEAREAMTLLLKGEVLPEQLGAFFMLMRVKEETAEELAGFADACIPLWQDLKADVIWPSYAGKRRQPPWYLLAIRLIRDAGYSVLIHGTHGHTEGRLYTADCCEDLGIPVASSHDQALSGVRDSGVSYVPCDILHGSFQDWLMTKHILGLRSPMNTLLRLIAPADSHGVQSVFHPNYGEVHQAACNLLGKSSLIMKGEGGEFEVNPERTTRCLFSDKAGRDENLIKLPGIRTHFDGKHTAPSAEAINRLWTEENDEYGYHAVVRTTAVVLMSLEASLTSESALLKAETLWQTRNKSDLRL